MWITQGSTFHASFTSKTESENIETSLQEMKKIKARKNVQLFQKFSLCELCVVMTSFRDDLKKKERESQGIRKLVRPSSLRYTGFQRKHSLEVIKHVDQLAKGT